MKQQSFKKIRMYFILMAIFSLPLLHVSASEPVTLLTKDEMRQMTEEEKEARVEVLEGRVAEIDNMDKKDLTKSERKALKKEVKGIEGEMKALDTGIYISGGVLLLIIILILVL